MSRKVHSDIISFRTLMLLLTVKKASSLALVIVAFVGFNSLPQVYFQGLSKLCATVCSLDVQNLHGKFRTDIRRISAATQLFASVVSVVDPAVS